MSCNYKFHNPQLIGVNDAVSPLGASYFLMRAGKSFVPKKNQKVWK